MDDILVNGVKVPVLGELRNGGLILHRKDLDNSNLMATQRAELVLCYLPHNTYHPFATWQHNVLEKGGDDCTYWGHYYEDFGTAFADYNRRGDK